MKLGCGDHRCMLLNSAIGPGTVGTSRIANSVAPSSKYSERIRYLKSTAN